MNKQVGNYRCVNEIGAGQFGTVYLAHHKADPNKLVAVKQICKKKIIEQGETVFKLFQTELTIMTHLKHPNLIRLIEFLESGNNYYLVMPYCDGGDLDKLLQARGRLSESEALEYLIQISNAFQELYKNKIMHRDFKLANVFLKSGRAVVGDFGFAKYGTEVTGTKLGTKATMAPEILFGRSGSLYTNKVDLWSIGVSLYEMIFGRLPFEWENEEMIRSMGLREMMIRNSGEKLKFPSDISVSKNCRDLLVRLLQFNAPDRISWKEFFEHPVFEQQLYSCLKSLNKFENLSGTEFLQNRDRLSNENSRHPESKQEGQPSRLDDGNVVKLGIQYRKEGCMSLTNERYIHEQKIILFIVDTAKALTNLEKVLVSLNLDEASMLASFIYALLLKKALLLMENASRSLMNGENVFGQNDFDIFIKNSVASDLAHLFKNEFEIHSSFLDHLINGFSKQWNNKELLLSLKLKAGLSYQSMNLIDGELRTIYTAVNDVCQKELNRGLRAGTLFDDLQKVPICIDCYDKFPFVKNGTLFDWKSFDSFTKF
jgi:serine/threonine protein kinase